MLVSAFRYGQQLAAKVLVCMAHAGAHAADCYDHHAARFQLDPNLLRAISDVESGGRPEAVNRDHWSRTGTMDVGLMQINTGWLPRLARHGISAADLRDPCTSIEIGAWILHDLVNKLGNTWEAVGAYNASCSQLKGAACTQARSAYAWKVFRKLRLRQAAAAEPSPAPARPLVRTAPVVGLSSLGELTEPSARNPKEEPRS